MIQGEMMKKYITFFLLSLLCFTSCAQQNIEQTKEIENETAKQTTEVEDNTAEEITDENGTRYIKSFGTYTVPTGWIESDVYSTKDKFFYVADGTQQNALPNNISINMGSNQYSADDHISFRQAIVQQLTMQLPKDTILNGSGSYTANDYVLYTFTFTIQEEDMTLVATQYYIVGDYKYIMVYESVYDGDTETVDMIAKNMVDTFTWTED